jgi:hypothetical protein
MNHLLKLEYYANDISKAKIIAGRAHQPSCRKVNQMYSQLHREHTVQVVSSSILKPLCIIANQLLLYRRKASSTSPVFVQSIRSANVRDAWTIRHHCKGIQGTPAVFPMSKISRPICIPASSLSKGALAQAPIPVYPYPQSSECKALHLDELLLFAR